LLESLLPFADSVWWASSSSSSTRSSSGIFWLPCGLCSEPGIGGGRPEEEELPPASAPRVKAQVERSSSLAARERGVPSSTGRACPFWPEPSPPRGAGPSKKASCRTCEGELLGERPCRGERTVMSSGCMGAVLRPGLRTATKTKAQAATATGTATARPMVAAVAAPSPSDIAAVGEGSEEPSAGECKVRRTKLRTPNEDRSSGRASAGIRPARIGSRWPSKAEASASICRDNACSWSTAAEGARTS